MVIYNIIVKVFWRFSCNVMVVDNFKSSYSFKICHIIILQSKNMRNIPKLSDFKIKRSMIYDWVKIVNQNILQFSQLKKSYYFICPPKLYPNIAGKQTFLQSCILVFVKKYLSIALQVYLKLKLKQPKLMIYILLTDGENLWLQIFRYVYLQPDFNYGIANEYSGDIL